MQEQQTWFFSLPVKRGFDRKRENSYFIIPKKGKWWCSWQILFVLAHDLAFVISVVSIENTVSEVGGSSSFFFKPKCNKLKWNVYFATFS